MNIFYSQLWCTVIKPEALPNYIQKAQTSPPKYRVNVPVSNLKAFADALRWALNRIDIEIGIYESRFLINSKTLGENTVYQILKSKLKFDRS